MTPPVLCIVNDEKVDNISQFLATIPENAHRHEEAQKIGKLISDHFNPVQ